MLRQWCSGCILLVGSFKQLEFQVSAGARFQHAIDHIPSEADTQHVFRTFLYSDPPWKVVLAGFETFDCAGDGGSHQ